MHLYEFILPHSWQVWAKNKENEFYKLRDVTHA